MGSSVGLHPIKTTCFDAVIYSQNIHMFIDKSFLPFFSALIFAYLITCYDTLFNILAIPCEIHGFPYSTSFA